MTAEEKREAAARAAARYRARNPEKVRAARVKYYWDNKPEQLEARRQHKLRQSHGMTAADLDEMFDAQDGRCYLCGDPIERAGRGTHIDHDHACCPEKRSCKLCRRGLSCGVCNAAIAMARDDPERLVRIARNLARAQKAAAARIGGAA